MFETFIPITNHATCNMHRWSMAKGINCCIIIIVYVKHLRKKIHDMDSFVHNYLKEWCLKCFEENNLFCIRLVIFPRLSQSPTKSVFSLCNANQYPKRFLYFQVACFNNVTLIVTEINSCHIVIYCCIFFGFLSVQIYIYICICIYVYVWIDFDFLSPNIELLGIFSAFICL